VAVGFGKRKPAKHTNRIANAGPTQRTRLVKPASMATDAMKMLALAK
jgi:hypothetical protein